MKSYGSAAPDTWVTTDPNPQGEKAVFISLREQPAEVPLPNLSPSMELIVGGQEVTAADVAHWMGATPKCALPRSISQWEAEVKPWAYPSIPTCFYESLESMSLEQHLNTTQLQWQSLRADILLFADAGLRCG